MPRTFDNRGRVLGDAVPYVAPDSVGSALWEFFHPEQVQEEYRLLGKEPPSIDEIRAGAQQQITGGTAARVEDIVTSITKTVTVVAVIYVGMEIIKNWPKKG